VAEVYARWLDKTEDFRFDMTGLAEPDGPAEPIAMRLRDGE
jgi:hypothetical protein